MTIIGIMDKAAKEIANVLPDNYEIDDLKWGDAGFEIPVFDVSSIASYERGPVNYFRFFLHDDESDEENMKRLEESLDEFCYQYL